jgi:hypothetical protein
MWLTFCGVGAHHQNGVSERRIQDLTDSARAMLAHAAHRNHSVSAHLWPYALRHASYTRTILPRNGHSKSPEDFFTQSQVRPTTKYLHPFGCSVSFKLLYKAAEHNQNGMTVHASAFIWAILPNTPQAFRLS